jgi:hypothetical protein
MEQTACLRAFSLRCKKKQKGTAGNRSIQSLAQSHSSSHRPVRYVSNNQLAGRARGLTGGAEERT